MKLVGACGDGGADLTRYAPGARRFIPSTAPMRLLECSIWSPNDSDTAYTVPILDVFMKRSMPGDDGRSV